MGDMNDDLSLNSSFGSSVTTTLRTYPPQSSGFNEQLNPPIIIAKRQIATPNLPLEEIIQTNNLPITSPLHTTTPGLSSPIHSKPLAVAIIPKRKAKGFKPPEPKLWATDERNDISLLDQTYQNALSKMLHLESQNLEEDVNISRVSSRHSAQTPEHRQMGTSARSLTARSESNFFPAIEIPEIPIEQESNVENETIGELEKSPQTTDTTPPPPIVDEEPARKLVESKAKNKLQNLNKFVLGHTSRKITSNWDLVENKFQSSPTHDIVIIKGDNGIGNPVKYKTLPLSSLTLLLCSQQIQIKYKELVPLYEMLKYTKDQINLSCKLAARKLVMNSSTKIEVQQQCQHEINELLLILSEPKVRIDLLKECVFSNDPEERKKEFEQLEKYRSERVAILLEEKKRKKENMEKAELRKKKAIHDFENCLQSVQYPRGPLNLKRFNHLKHVIEYCYNSLLDEYYEKTVAVDPLVIELIGPDMFPQTSQESKPTVDVMKTVTTKMTIDENDTDLQIPNEGKLAALRKAGYIRREFPPQTWKLDIVGPPSLVNIFRLTLITGKGLYGTSNTDVVEMLQAYCATRISAYYRGFTRRWRYQVARRAWKHLYHFMKSKVFVAWAAETKKIRTLRHYCHRKIKAWSFFTRRALRRRYYFRVCYWPLFIWRRYAIETARAREKTKFLVGRVLPTVSLIKTFGAWKRYYLNEISYNKPANEFYKQKLHYKLHKRLRWWAYWMRRRKGLRRGWIEKGYVMRCIKIEDCMRLPFQVWRASVVFKIRLRDFVKRNAHKFREFILPNTAPHLPPVKVKITEEEKKKLLEASSDTSDPSQHHEDSLFSKKTKKLVRAKLKALRRVQTTSDVETSDRAVSTVELQAFSRQLGHTKFEWKDDFNRFDLDIAEDEMLHISPQFHELYNQYCQLYPDIIHEENENVNYGLKFRTIKKPTKAFIDEIKERFYEVEIWSIFDAAFCYHRMAHRVFHNLRVHAIISRNKKKIKNRYRDNLMRKVLNALFRWATRGLDDLVEDSQTQTTSKDTVPALVHSKAEELAFRSRTARMEKLKKRRDAAKIYKELENTKQKDNDVQQGNSKDDPHSEDNDDYSLDAGPRARQRRLALEFKRINGKKNSSSYQSSSSTTTITGQNSQHSIGIRKLSSQSDSTASFGYGGDTTIHEGNEKEEEGGADGDDDHNHSIYDNKSNQPTIYHTLSVDTQHSAIQSLIEQKIDMLEWDRQEREHELDLMQEMIKYGQQVKEETKKVVRKAAKETAKNTAVNDTRDQIMDNIFTKEALGTDKSILKELNYVSSWKIKMASRMIDTLAKIHSEVTFALLEAEKRKYFRALRLPLLLARSVHMCNRKKLANWIRICRRLSILYQKVPLYRSLKLKWGVFNRWLKFYEKENLDCSSGLIQLIKRRYQLRDTFSQHLSSNNFLKTVYPRNSRLKSFGNQLNSIFYRWKEYTQDSIMLEYLSNKVAHYHRLRLLQKCFYCLNTKLSLKYSYQDRIKHFSYSYRRAYADIEQISKRYFAKRRYSFSYIIRKYQNKTQILLKRIAKKMINFKSFILNIERDIDIRIMTEQKLLVTAYENRGMLQYHDILLSSNMIKSTGDKFYDPKPTKIYDIPTSTSSNNVDTSAPTSKNSNLIIPPGYNINKIKIAIQTGLGIVGWQIIWNADGCLPIESPIRGKIIGSNITQYEFILKQYDYLIEIEYCTEGIVIIGIRFFTHLYGWSKWIGNKGNSLSKKYRLHCNMGDKDMNDTIYKPSNRHEIRSPGMPWEYIIGFSGIESTVRATSLGIVIRRVSHQHIFSYHWVNESIYFTKQKLLNSEDLSINSSSSSSPPIISTSTSTLPAISGQHTSNTTSGINPRPSTPSQKRSMDLLRHLSDLQTEFGIQHDQSTPGSHPHPHAHAHGAAAAAAVPIDYLDPLDDNNNHKNQLTSSEEQFFDIIRMRIVEIKAAEHRVINFARYLWTNMKLRFHSEYYLFSNIKILSPLINWLLETLCKSLVLKPEDPQLLSKLYSTIHYSQVELEILENRLINSISSINTTELSEITKPWYGKVLLGPQLRLEKKIFYDSIQQLKENKLNIEKKIELIKQNIINLQEETNNKMPRISLSKTLCNNFRLKINAARYKSNLLEKMTLNSLKEHLGGHSSSTSSSKMYTTPSLTTSMGNGSHSHGGGGGTSGGGGLGGDDDEEINELMKNKVSKYDQNLEIKSLYQITTELNDEIQHSRNSVIELYEKTSFPFIQLRAASSSNTTKDQLSNPILLNQDTMSITQTRKKSFRKCIAVNPNWGNTSRSTSSTMSAGSGGGTSAPGSAATQQRIRASSVQLKRINSKQFISTK